MPGHSKQKRKSRDKSASGSGSYSSSGSASQDGEKQEDEGHINIADGEYIRDRYQVLGLAGQGTFGKVLDVLDTKHNERMALKVVRAVKRYSEAAYVEMEILEKIRKADPLKESLCVRLYTTFQMKHNHQTHVCLGFEKLGRSLYEFIKKNKYRGFGLNQVREFGWQLLKAIAFCHSIKLIHTDLKPENILLCKSDYRLINRGKHDRDYRVPENHDIRLIDFGGATFDYDHHSRIINTRQYRSPEVLLDIGWTYPSDLWSVGCILAELYTGELLFGTHEDLEHLALMEKIIGKKLPERMTRKALEKVEASRSPEKKSRRRSSSCTRADQLLHRNGTLRWPEGATSVQSAKHVAKAITIEEQFEDLEFKDLLLRLLDFDPDNRITAKAALEHRFFQNSIARERDVQRKARTAPRRPEAEEDFELKHHRRTREHHSHRSRGETIDLTEDESRGKRRR